MTKRIKPVSRVIKIEAEIKRIAGEVFSRKPRAQDWAENWVPCVDIHENKRQVVVEIEVPGVDERNITVLLHSNRIQVKGWKGGEPGATERIRYFRLEREYGRFERYIYLPCLVIPEKAAATLENGLLTIVIEKLSHGLKKKEVILTIDKPTE